MRQLGVVLLALNVVACGAGGTGSAPTSGVTVAASIPPHAWLVERIGGPGVEVISVLGPGDSPATYQPTDVQVSGLLASRTLFRAGVPFEAGSWFGAVAGNMEVVDLSDGIADRVMDEHADDGVAPLAGLPHPHGAIDPHAWLSPRRLSAQARLVADTLERLEPDRAADLEAKLDLVLFELDELDRWIADTLEPYRGRAFVVFHPSWGYFADDYGLDQIAIEIAGKEPSDADLTRLQQQAREHDISVVFVQPQIAGQAARAVADAIGARIETLDPLAADVPANLRRVTEALVGGFDD